MSVELKPIYANLVPTTLEYRLHSKYWSRRRHKPHDFTVEVAIDFEFLFPDFVTCSNAGLSQYLRRKTILLTATYKGITATLEIKNVNLIEAFRKKVQERGKPYSVRFLMRYLKEERDHLKEEIASYWGISKKLAEAIANDIIDYLVNGTKFKIVGWEVNETGTIDPSSLYDRIETPFEEAYPYDYDNFIRDVMIGIDDIVRQWFSEGLAWDYPVEGELSELDGGVSLDQECQRIYEAQNILISDWFDESFMITHVEYRKADAYDVEPIYRDYWTQSLHSFLEEHLAEIKNVIWKAYVSNILRRVLKELGVIE